MKIFIKRKLFINSFQKNCEIVFGIKNLFKYKKIVVDSYEYKLLLKLLIGDYLPNNANEFLDLMKLYFPYTYDIKYLINGNEIYKGGLSKIANELNIERKGEVHQAGSDSLITIEVFFKLIENNSISKKELNFGKNILYGIGDGSDDNETFMYTKFAPGIDITFFYHSINQDVNLGKKIINKCE